MFFDLARAEYCANKKRTKIYFKKWKIHYISLALAYYRALVVNINVVQCPPEKKKVEFKESYYVHAWEMKKKCVCHDIENKKQNKIYHRATVMVVNMERKERKLPYISSED